MAEYKNLYNTSSRKNTAARRTNRYDLYGDDDYSNSYSSRYRSTYDDDMTREDRYSYGTRSARYDDNTNYGRSSGSVGRSSYGRTSAYDGSERRSTYGRSSAYSGDASYDRPTSYGRRSSYSEEPSYGRTSTYDRNSSYGRTSAYSENAYGRSSAYSGNAYGRTSAYSGNTYSRSSIYDRNAYGRSSAYGYDDYAYGYGYAAGGTRTPQSRSSARSSYDYYRDRVYDDPYSSRYQSAYASKNTGGRTGTRSTYSSLGTTYSSYSGGRTGYGTRTTSTKTTKTNKKTTKKKGLFNIFTASNKNTKGTKDNMNSRTAKSTVQSSANRRTYSSAYGYGTYNNMYGRGMSTDSRYTYRNGNVNNRNNVKRNTKPVKNKKRNALGEFALEGIVSIIRSARGSRAPEVDLKRNRSAVGVYAFIAVLVIVYLIGYTINFYSKKITTYDTIHYGSVDTPTSFTGVIIRDETVYTTPEAGVISYEVTDNDRVKKDTAVCSIKDEAVLGSMEENLEEINENIFKLQQDREDMSIYSDDITKANEQIKTLVDNAAFGFSNGSLSGLYELKSNVSKKLDNRNQMLLTENKGDLTDLVSQREAAENEIAQNTTTITAKQGGVVSYYTDGLEATYTPDSMESLTKEQTQETDKSENNFKNSVEENESVFKLVSSNIWYIAVYMRNEEVSDWEVDDHRTLYTQDNAGNEYTLDAVVESIKDMGSEKYIVLRITKDMEAFINNRSISFETSKPKTGYKVANSAIVEETSLKIPAEYIENENTVYKVVNGSTQKVNISISGSDEEEKVVYTTLNLGTLNIGDVLQKPGDASSKYTIEDTMTIKGIYVVNSGIAEFKKINTDNAISNSTHTVLDIKTNPNINIYDRVITDTSNITKQQKVYT